MCYGSSGKSFFPHKRHALTIPLSHPSHLLTGLSSNLTDTHQLPVLYSWLPILWANGAPFGDETGSITVKGNYLQGPIHSHTVWRAHFPHFTPQRTVREKKLERCNHVVYSAAQVSFAICCLSHTEKSQIPTQAFVISMREKPGIEMGAGSFGVFPHTHSFALNIQEFKLDPSKKY